MTPAQRDALTRRYQAAETLERARQTAREADRYGLLTGAHIDAVAAAEAAYDQHTKHAQAVNR